MASTGTDDWPVLAGFHAVEARLRSDPQGVAGLWLDSRRRDGRLQRLRELARAASCPVHEATPAELDALCPQAPHQGVVARARPQVSGMDFHSLLAAIGPSSLLLILDGVTDPRNLGACLRTAAGAGVQAVLVPRDRSAGLGPAALKAAAGADALVPLVEVVNLARAITELQEAGVRVVGADGNAEDGLWSVDLRGPLALALGAEGSGLRRLTRERCDATLRIPMAGGLESLNVSVATGICLFEALRQRSVD